LRRSWHEDHDATNGSYDSALPDSLHRLPGWGRDHPWPWPMQAMQWQEDHHRTQSPTRTRRQRCQKRYKDRVQRWGRPVTWCRTRWCRVRNWTKAASPFPTQRWWPFLSCRNRSPDSTRWRSDSHWTPRWSVVDHWYHPRWSNCTRWVFTKASIWSSQG